MTDFLTCNLNQLTPMITVVLTNSARADPAITTIHQIRLHASIHVRYILLFFSNEKEAGSLTLRAHTPHYTESFPVPVLHYTLAVSLC